jgi:type II secretory pathway pseudopilin PulG
MSGLRARLAEGDGEAGMTLVELLVASAMSVILVGAACMMLISAVQSQPKLSEKSQDISTARYVLERMTREIRNGVDVYSGASPSSVSFDTRVRRSACGAGVQENPSVQAIECRVTYSCGTAIPATTPATYACSRTETAPNVATGGTPTTIVSGLSSSKVFNYSPDLKEPTFVGITLRIPDPGTSSDLTVSDGAGLRILSFAN